MAPLYSKLVTKYGFLLFSSLISLTFPDAASAASVTPPKKIITVTAQRVPVPVDETGSSVTIFTQKDIEKRQSALASDVIRTAPGVALNRAGSMGQFTQVRMRGTEANHVLVLLDGIKANDPGASVEFNFANLLASDIEQIEVLRGPQSALYGSEAIGGVINITTKSGEPGFQGTAFGEMGSFGTLRGGAGISGGEERWHGAANISSMKTQGTNISRFGDEDDEYQNTSFSARGVFDVLPNIHVGASLRVNNDETQSDVQDFAFPTTPTNGLLIDSDEVRKSKFIYGSVWAQGSFFNDHWSHKLSTNITHNRNKNYSFDIFQSGDRSARRNINYQTDVKFEVPELLDSTHGISFAYERERLTFFAQGPTPALTQTQYRILPQRSFAGEYRLSLLNRVFLSASIRHDNNDFYDDRTTYRAGGSLHFDETGTRIHGSHGTGFAAPNPYEAFGFDPTSFVGNPALKPETSKGFDFGVEQKLFDDKLLFDVTYFKASLHDEINTTVVSFFPVFLLSVDNLNGRSKRQGIEIAMQASPLDNFDIRGSYTYLDAEQPGGREEVRRPRHSADLNFNYRAFDDKANLNLDILYTGNQKDTAFSAFFPPRVELDKYILVTLAGSYEIADGVKLTVRGENLLDQEYEEIFSYRGSGIAGYFGVSFAFGE